MGEFPVGINEYYVGGFALLVVLRVLASAVTKWQDSTGPAPPPQFPAEFVAFQWRYLTVYLIMMGGDWMQGPYMYDLYQSKGFEQGEIGTLFMAGFGSSLAFGMLVGSLSDKYGRKLSCMTFGVLYSISCLCTHGSTFSVLLAGRVLGGISTSILFSSFEAWLVHQHYALGFPAAWLSSTFSSAYSLNSFVAIAAGVTASFVKDQFGSTAPFDVSLVLLVIGTFLIATTWTENYGDSSTALSTAMLSAVGRVAAGPRLTVLLLGVIQSFFEGAMYIFVFMWTPALESTSPFKGTIRHGWIFASFMLCTSIGSTLFSLVQRTVEVSSAYMMALAAAVLMVAGTSTDHTSRLASFFLFEGCIGMFWPCIGVMRSRYIPEDSRATVMNIFRIPLNGIVLTVLVRISMYTDEQVFMLAATIMIVAFTCQIYLVRLTVEDPASQTKDHLSEAELSTHSSEGVTADQHNK